MDPTNPKGIKEILVEVLNRPSITKKEEVMTIDAPDWKSPIIEYLKSLTMETDSESAKLRIRAAGTSSLMTFCTRNLSTFPISDV